MRIITIFVLFHFVILFITKKEGKKALATLSFTHSMQLIFVQTDCNSVHIDAHSQNAHTLHRLRLQKLDNFFFIYSLDHSIRLQTNNATLISTYEIDVRFRSTSVWSARSLRGYPLIFIGTCVLFSSSGITCI